ncbi:MAG: hypothetical protein FWF70_03390 [Bacteroidetes bacterium]|nr:hypothetical protein [Bacteroidota bacterium]MCL1968132.1 hypothetical protein [Bacteroidota bacterium]
MNKPHTAYRIPHTAFCLLLSAFCFLPVFAQNNRLTNNEGQLLWQYNQIVHIDEQNPNTIRVSFIFINGVNQTAISLRQELFNSQIEWTEISNSKAEKEDRVEFLTTNLAPNQSVIWRYVLKTKTINKELILEKSALLIMNADFEVRKEIIPEQRFLKQ